MPRHEDKQCNQPAQINEKIICENYIGGLSTRAIGRKYEISQSRVLRILIKHEIQRRPLSEAMRKFCIDEDYFSRIDSEREAYALGYFVAEACLQRRAHRSISVHIKVSINEREHLQKLISQFSNYQVRIGHGEKEPVCVVQITSTKIANDLHSWGVPFPRELSRFPRIDPSLFNHFIRGVWDGDGTICKSDGQWIFVVCGSYPLLEGIQRVLIQKCNLMQVKICRDSRRFLYYLKYTGNKQVPRILSWLYEKAKIYLERKYRKTQLCLEEVIGGCTIK
jgi:hypothetical protein